MRSWLLTTCGYPFSGKSTLARAVSERLDMALVAVDEQNEALGFNIANGNPSDRDWLRAYRAAYAQIERELAAGRSVVFDSIGYRRKDRDRACRLAERHKAGPLVVWLDVSVGEARERLDRNATNPTRSRVPSDSFERIVADFELPQSDEATVIYRPDIELGMWVERVLHPAIER